MTARRMPRTTSRKTQRLGSVLPEPAKRQPVSRAFVETLQAQLIQLEPGPSIFVVHARLTSIHINEQPHIIPRIIHATKQMSIGRLREVATIQRTLAQQRLSRVARHHVHRIAILVLPPPSIAQAPLLTIRQRRLLGAIIRRKEDEASHRILARRG